MHTTYMQIEEVEIKMQATNNSTTAHKLFYILAKIIDITLFILFYDFYLHSE
jgi:hypothetical protein